MGSARAGNDARYSGFAQKQPVHFLENRSQMTDMNGRPVPYVLFKAQAPGMDVYITEKGLTYVFIKEEDNKQETGNKSRENTAFEWNRIDMALMGASIKKENIIKEVPSTAHINFFYNNCPDGIYGVKDYEKITIKDVYPGIDWVFYNSTRQGFKYDFVVHPEADPNQIKLVYSSKEKPVLDLNGELQIKTAFGNLTEQTPESFLGQKRIESKFKLLITEKNDKGGYDVTFGFDIEESWQSAVGNLQTANCKLPTLIIDPQLHWATFFGGTMSDGPVSITTDGSGNVFVTGYTSSQTNFPVQNAGTFYQDTNWAYIAAFIMKFDNAGALLWSTYYGSNVPNDQVWGVSIAADGSGNVFVTGYTTSATLPTQNSGTFFQGTYGGGADAFILKFDNSGNRLWATYYGGSGEDRGYSVTTDASGNVFVTGYTGSTNFPTQNAGTFFQGTRAGTYDAFILKFDDAGNRLWATYYGDNANDYGHAIRTDSSGNVFIAGHTVGHTGFNNFPVQNAGTFFQGMNAGANTADVFILKFDNAGNRLWATLYGGTGDDDGYSLIVDASGNVFVAGETNSTNFPTQNAGTFFQGTNGGGSSPADAFILKFDNSGNRLWATYYGGNGDDYSINYFFPTYNLGLDPCGNLYVSFETESTNMTTLAGCDSGYVHSFNGGYDDQFLSLFTNTGTLLWATYLGGSGSDHRSPIAVDRNGNLFASGEWSNLFGGTTVILSTYPLTNPGGSTFYSSYSGQDDGFLAKFCSNSCICSSFPGCTILSTLPRAVFTSSDTTFCSEIGVCIDFFDHSLNNPTSWQWSFPGGVPDTSSQQNPTAICYNNAGTYPVTLIVTNAAGSDTLTVSPMIIFSSGAAVPVVTVSNDTMFSSYATTYQWNLNGFPIAGATDSVYLCSQGGAYSVRITDSLGCSAVSNGVYSSCITGISQFTVYGLQFTVYPNPASTEFTVFGLSGGRRVPSEMEIYNVFGEQIYSAKLNCKKVNVNCSLWPTGVFIIRITSENGISNMKIIKK